MLQFTKQVDYGLQLVMTLNHLNKKELLSLREFSKDSKISFLFLQRIARKLRQAKIIDAVKGAQGGYYLLANLQKIKLKNLVEAIEGEYAVSNCLKKNCHCEKENNCTSRPIFKAVNEQLIDYLNKVVLADFIKYAKKS